jgi:glycosyltransferase involved in cell wall biosynthesis
VTGLTLPISAIVITRNEEANIARCLESLSFCEETIVVDSGSQDQTCEIAKRFTAKVYHRPWEGFSAQKNAAHQWASQTWVLSVDADECVTADLEAEIRQLFTAGEIARFSAFSIPRRTIHFGKWIRHGGWYPNRLVRLFKHTEGQWEGNELHEKWVTRGEVGALNADLEHHSFVDLADQVGRNNRYSSLGAEKLLREQHPFSVWKLLVKPITKFLETYCLKRGFLDGYPGFIISISAAYSVFLKWAKLWELRNAKIQNKTL